MLSSFCSGTIFGQPTRGAPYSILALHGWRRDHGDFAPLFSMELPENRSGLAIDLPGFGATPPPGTAWGSREYAESLLCLFDVLDERPIIVGHSFGGRIALELAALAPDRVGALVLTGVPLVAPERVSRRSMRYRVARRFARYGVLSPERLESARRRYGSEDYRQAEGVMREILVRLVNERYDDVMARIACHVELVWGAADTQTPVALAQLAQARFADASLTIVPGVGHLLPTEAPAQLYAAIERSLR